MKKLVILSAGLLAVFSLSACSTPDYDPNLSPAKPYVPRVTMPQDLNRNEQNLVGDVEQMLEQSGLRPTDRTGAEYQLAFSVEDGPVNADVTLELYQGRDRIAHAFARVGGPRIVFKRQQVIRESFDKALRHFEAQLPRASNYRTDTSRYRLDDANGQAGASHRPPYGGGGQPNPYNQPDPYSQPNPYGQPEPDYSY